MGWGALCLAGLLGCSGRIGPAAGPDADSSNPSAAALAPADRLEYRRLSREEFLRSVSDITGVGLSRVRGLAESLPRDPVESTGFLAPHPINDGYVEALSEVAQAVAADLQWDGVDADWAGRCSASASPQGPAEQNECAEELAAIVGRRAFRRPPSDDEQSDLFGAFQGLAAPDLGHSYDERLRGMVEVALLSPQFLYHWELPPSAGEEVEGDRAAMTSYEIAAQLSYFFWGTVPDEELSRLADEDALRDAETLARTAERLLDDPRSRYVFRSFFDQLLRLDELDEVERSSQGGAELNGGLRESLREEAHAFIDYVMGEGATLSELYQSPVVAVDRRLAEHYGMAAPSSDGFTMVPAEGTGRHGLLTLGGVLVVNASHDSASPTHFGKTVRTQLLCGTLSAPPADVDTNLPPLEPAQTVRDRFSAHMEQPYCNACHRFMDPIGFAALSFDQLGRQDPTPEDSSGTIVDLVPGSDVDFADIGELSQILATHQQARACMSEQWAHFAARRRVSTKAELVRAMTEAFHASGGNLRQLAQQLATSELFRYREPITR